MSTTAIPRGTADEAGIRRTPSSTTSTGTSNHFKNLKSTQQSHFLVIILFKTSEYYLPAPMRTQQIRTHKNNHFNKQQ
jgi:hypothetical protein